jgi:hypothetical protein
MIYISSLVPVVATMAPSVSDPIIMAAIRRAATLFCEESGIWRGEVEVDPPRAGAFVLEHFSPRGSRLSSLISVVVDGRELELAGDELFINDERRTRPRKAALINDTITVDGAFVGGERVQAYGTFAPTPTADQLPDLFGGMWYDALVSGALAELFRYAPSSAQSQQLAAHHASLFTSHITHARSRARSGGTHARRTVSYGGL